MECRYTRNNKAWAHIAMWANVSLFRRFTYTNEYRTGSVKTWETRHKISVDIRIFFTVYSLKAREWIADGMMPASICDQSSSRVLSIVHIIHAPYLTSSDFISSLGFIRHDW